MAGRGRRGDLVRPHRESDRPGLRAVGPVRRPLVLAHVDARRREPVGRPADRRTAAGERRPGGAGARSGAGRSGRQRGRGGRGRRAAAGDPRSAGHDRPGRADDVHVHDPRGSGRPLRVSRLHVGRVRAGCDGLRNPGADIHQPHGPRLHGLVPGPRDRPHTAHDRPPRHPRRDRHGRRSAHRSGRARARRGPGGHRRPCRGPQPGRHERAQPAGLGPGGRPAPAGLRRCRPRRDDGRLARGSDRRVGRGQ